MEDPVCSGDETKTLKTDPIGSSESVVVSPSDSTVRGSVNGATAAASTALRVPKVVVEMADSDSRDGSSTATAAGASKKERKGKKGRRKEKRGDAVAVAVAAAAAEGRRGEEASGAPSAVSVEPKLDASGWTEISLAKASSASEKKRSAMERADISPSYSSDEWDSNDESDSNDDHTDSSDDDDPKSQVDRLIERGTQMYMESENSALSSEDDSDDDDDDDEYDSESDITDVSPLVSATSSPLKLSPVLPRRTVPTSPLALHDNRDLAWDGSPVFGGATDNYGDDATNMDLLLRAVIELENKNQAEKYNLNHHHSNRNSHPSGLPGQRADVFIHPIRDNPHHFHLRKSNHQRRKNMSFSNEEVRKIDRENKILLRKIMAAHTRSTPTLATTTQSAPTRTAHNKPSNSAVNRKKGDLKIRKDNLLLLKKIQEAKPSKEVVESRVPALGSIEPLLSPVAVTPSRSLRSPTGSCGAFMRSMSQPGHHVPVPPPRKETAL